MYGQPIMDTFGCQSHDSRLDSHAAERLIPFSLLTLCYPFHIPVTMKETWGMECFADAELATFQQLRDFIACRLKHFAFNTNILSFSTFGILVSFSSLCRKAASCRTSSLHMSISSPSDSRSSFTGCSDPTP